MTMITLLNANMTRQLYQSIIIVLSLGVCSCQAGTVLKNKSEKLSVEVIKVRPSTSKALSNLPPITEKDRNSEIRIIPNQEPFQEKTNCSNDNHKDDDLDEKDQPAIKK